MDMWKKNSDWMQNDVGFHCLDAHLLQLTPTPLVTFCLASVPPILCAEREERRKEMDD